MNSCAIYARISSSDPTYNVYMKNLNQIVNKNGFVVFKIYEDSYNDNTFDALEKLFIDAKAGHFSHVVAKNLSSFGESTSTVLKAISSLTLCNIIAVYTFFGSFLLDERSSSNMMINVQASLEQFIHFDKGMSSQVENQYCSGINLHAISKHYESQHEKFLAV